MIEFDNTFVDGDKIWFVGKRDNILYRMSKDCETELVGYLDYSDDESYFRKNNKCVRYKDYIICLPDKGKSIVIFDINTKNTSKIELDINVERISIFNAKVYNDKLWCVSYSAGVVFKVNIDSKCVEKKYAILEGNAENCNGEAEFVDNKVFLVNRIAPQVIIFDLDEEKTEVLDIDCTEKGFGTISVINDFLYLTGYSNKIYIFNIRNKNLDVIDLNKKMNWIVDSDSTICPRFYQSVKWGNSILITPLNSKFYISNEVVLLNVLDGKVDIFNFEPREERKVDENLVYSHSDEKYIYIQNQKESMLKIDVENKTIKSIEEHVMINDKNVIRKKIKSSIYMIENELIGLKEYIENFS